MKPIKGWLVYDASENYFEYTLCPTREFARDIQFYRGQELHEGDWKIMRGEFVPGEKK